VRIGGRVATFSEFGASILVAAPSGDKDSNEVGLFTTDLLGSGGVNVASNKPPNLDLWDYVYPTTGAPDTGFSGTSASAPQIAGVAALILSANTNLTYRDVQQILILSARHFRFCRSRCGHERGWFENESQSRLRYSRRWSRGKSGPTMD